MNRRSCARSEAIHNHSKIFFLVNSGAREKYNFFYKKTRKNHKITKTETRKDSDMKVGGTKPSVTLFFTWKAPALISLAGMYWRSFSSCCRFFLRYLCFPLQLVASPCLIMTLFCFMAAIFAGHCLAPLYSWDRRRIVAT